MLAVNKMDLVGYDKAVFERIEAEYRAFATRFDGIGSITPIPVSALRGENVLTPSAHMDWYDGPTLMACLETVEVADTLAEQQFRMPVQWVKR